MTVHRTVFPYTWIFFLPGFIGKNPRLDRTPTVHLPLILRERRNRDGGPGSKRIRDHGEAIGTAG